MIPGMVIINEEREKIFQSKIPNSQLPDADSNIRFVIPIMLDRVSKRLAAGVDTMSWRSTIPSPLAILYDCLNRQLGNNIFFNFGQRRIRKTGFSRQFVLR